MSRKTVDESDDEARQGEGFVARWARLKRQETGAEQPEAAPARISDPGEDADGADGPGVDVKADAPLPSVEDLKPDSDIKAFFDKRVPEELRRLAMRRMWTLDPAIRDFIEMAENQYDWNDPNGVPGFGPLPADTDMEALLAQATGVWKPAEKEQLPDADKPIAVADATDVAPDASGECEAADGVQNDPDQSDLHQVSDDSPAGGAPDEQVDGELQSGVAASEFDGSHPHATAGMTVAESLPDDVAPQPRRRHGGALPV